MIQYPRKIKKGDVFGVTATSSGVTLDYNVKRLANAYLHLKELGYTCFETDNVLKNEKFVSSSGAKRAQEFMELWQNDKISLIAQVYGGEFLMEMLPFLDEKIIKSKKPKWVTGYSDSSLLNFYLTTKFTIATATTANILHFGMDPLDKSLMKQIEIFENGEESLQENFSFYEKEKASKEERIDIPYQLTEKVLYKHLYSQEKEVIKGRLIGGCIEALITILGTKYDNTVSFCSKFQEGMLWYLENYGADPLTLYRYLWQMKEAGWFFNAKGFLFGRTRGEFLREDFSYLDALHKVFDDMGVPVIYDVDFGHVAPQWTMINGSLAEFNYKNGTGSILEKLK